MLREGLADELIVYLAPKLLGSTGRPMFELPSSAWPRPGAELVEHQRRVGPDLRLRFSSPIQSRARGPGSAPDQQCREFGHHRKQ
jgi:diaminohydroxyphosphoribosylaminopyrimidine deaminase/5-amino-6-(5-phosphoribosylamino)uracil reductase